jgi:hypothetical protein
MKLPERFRGIQIKKYKNNRYLVNKDGKVIKPLLDGCDCFYNNNKCPSLGYRFWNGKKYIIYKLNRNSGKILRTAKTHKAIGNGEYILVDCKYGLIGLDFSFNTGPRRVFMNLDPTTCTRIISTTLVDEERYELPDARTTKQ